MERTTEAGPTTQLTRCPGNRKTPSLETKIRVKTLLLPPAPSLLFVHACAKQPLPSRALPRIIQPNCCGTSKVFFGAPRETLLSPPTRSGPQEKGGYSPHHGFCIEHDGPKLFALNMTGPPKKLVPPAAPWQRCCIVWRGMGSCR